MKAKARSIVSSQSVIHQDLKMLAQRYQASDYQRPIAEHSQKSLDEILDFIDGRDFILDACCGVGESSFHLAANNPDSLVVGIDKSKDRLERNNSFKKELPSNLLLIRGELLDLWCLLAEEERKRAIKIQKQYILYPNPYPKPGDVKRRWHGNPISPFIFSLSDEIELRSNWKMYLEEFCFVAALYGFDGNISLYRPDVLITPFERKFFEADQDIFILKLKRTSI